MKNHVICLCIALAAAGGAYYIGTSRSSNCNISSTRCGLRTNMRKLWSDHVWWTRDYLITSIADMPDVKAATDRLLQNQSDIGAAIASYYGKEAGDKLTGL